MLPKPGGTVIALDDHMIMALLSTFVLAQTQMADIGFAGYDFHIGVELGPTTLSFKLCKNKELGCVPLNACAYPEAKLASAVSAVEDSVVRKDLRQLFFNSGPAVSPVERFYPIFKRVLEQSDSCVVPELSEVEGRLRGRG